MPEGHPRTVTLAWWIATLLVGVGTCACLAQHATTPRQLPSGRAIGVVWSGVLAEGGVVWALKYRTSVPATDRQALIDEAAEIWAEVQSEADASGARRASLWPINLDAHMIHLEGWRLAYVTVHSSDFSFEKDDTGKWRRVVHGATTEVGTTE